MPLQLKRSLIWLSLSVAHKIYGIPQTINTANYFYFLAYQKLSVLRPTVVRRHAYAPRASLDSGLEDDIPLVTEKLNFPERIIPNHDLDLMVNGMSFVYCHRQF